MPRTLLPVFATFALLLCVACGGAKLAATGGMEKPAVDADPYALLPPAALVVVRVDAAAVFANPTVGSGVAALAETLVPLGDDAGFRASRDVDRVLVATYATSGGDVAAIVSGRFDVDRLAQATRTKRATPVTKEPHGALTLYRSGREAWTPLTPRTLVAGTPEGVTLVLDRIAKGSLDRWEPGWMTSTLETPATVFAAAGDFASRPLAAAAIGAVNLPWVSGIHQVRATGVLKPDALAVTATLSYGTPAQAKDAEGGLRGSVRMLDVFGAILGGVRLQGFDTKLDSQDLHCSFGLEAPTLHALLDLAPRLIPSLEP